MSEPRERAAGIVARTVSVLEAVAESKAAVGPRELGRRTGIDRSAVGRILQDLAEIGVLDRVSEGYVPGGRLYRLGRVTVARDDITAAAVPILKELSGRFNESCYVSVRDGNSAVNIDGVESTNPVRYVVPIGEPFPLYVGAPGRAILSGLPSDEVAEIVADADLEALPSEAATDAEKLLELVWADRERGYTATTGERIEGGFGVAAPFFDSSGLCKGSLVFTCPVSRLDETRVPEYGNAVREAARMLSERLGYRKDL